MSPKLHVVPLSQQAQQEILRYIREMDPSKGNKLPREELLAEMIGVSRITIRQALNNLEAQGIVFRKQGKGTFANFDSLDIKVPLSPCLEFVQMIENSGYRPSVKLLSIQKVTGAPEIYSMLQMDPSEALIQADKLFYADHTLCAFCRDYFSAQLIGGEEGFQDFCQHETSIYTYIYALSGQKATWDKVELGVADQKTLLQLNEAIPQSDLGTTPFLYLKTLNYNENDLPIIFANEYINPTIIHFNLIRKKVINYG